MQLNFTGIGEWPERLFSPARTPHQAQSHPAIKKWIVMQIKLVSLILFIGCTTVTARSFAQRVTLSASNAPLAGVLHQIEEQTGYQFLFFDKDIRQAKKVTIHVKNAGISKVLKLCFNDQPLSYAIVDKTVVVKLMDTLSGNDMLSRADTIGTVHGRIVNQDGEPLSGATIRVKGADFGTVTDDKGSFILNNVDAKVTLIVSCLGYRTSEIKLDGQREITIQLQPQISKLSGLDVTVSTGYQLMPRERAAGSFGMVTRAMLDKRSNYNIETYLEGQVPGLLMSSDGQITIRGQSTIYANKNPLIVVDGFPIERDLSTINPNDVENITILKDASAASIWGVRAANGVIVIQTKRGASARKPLDISFNSSVSVSGAPDLSKLPLAPASSFIDYEKYKVEHGLVAQFGNPRSVITPVEDAYLNDPAHAAGIADSLGRNNAYHEFERLFMHSAVRQQYGLSLAGKGERTTTRASFNYDNRQTYMKHSGDERYLMDFYQTAAITRKLHLEAGAHLAVMNYRNNGLALSDLKNLLPYQQLLDRNGHYIPQPMTFYQPDKDSLVAMGYPYNWDYNLVQEYRNKNNTAKDVLMTAVARVNYEIIKGLSFNSSFQYEHYTNQAAVLQNEQTYYVRNLVNYSTSVSNGVLTTGIPKGDVYSQSDIKTQSQTFRNQLRYDGNLGSPLHALSAIAGLEIRQVTNSSSGQTKYGYDPETLQFANIDYLGGYTDVNGYREYLRDGSVFTEDKNRFVSVFSNAGYTFKEKYTLNASARLDQTNLFGSTKKYRNVWLWSVGAGWNIYRESFMEKSPFSLLVLRATYGINGNVDRSTSPFLIAGVAKDAQTNLNYAYISNPENPQLRWEKTAVTNLGIDFGLKGDRVYGTLEYYNRYSTDLLGDATVNDTYGFSSAYINYAGMRNKGVDADVTAVIINKPFSLNARINYSYNKNEVTKVDFPQETVGAYVFGIPQAGKPLNYIYSYRWAGLDDQGAPQVYNAKHEPTGYTSEMTDIRALVYQGSSVPTQYGGLYVDLGYKGLSFTAGFVYKMGYYFRVPQIHYAPLFESPDQVNKAWDDRWQQPGDEQHTNIPAMPASQTNLNIYDNYTLYADINVATASNIRFQELLLNYKLPPKLTAKLASSGIDLGFQVRNLGVILFNKQKLDPEYLTIIDYNNFVVAPPAEFTFSIKANF